MSVTRTCDLCGREIAEKDSYVVVQILGAETSQWKDGWLTHLHAGHDWERENCMERFQELVLLLREQGEYIGAIPVAHERQIRHMRDQHHNPARDAAAESFRELGLTPRAKSGLVRRGIDLEAAAAMSDEALLAVDGVGPGALKLLRGATGEAPRESVAAADTGRGVLTEILDVLYRRLPAVDRGDPARATLARMTSELAAAIGRPTLAPVGTEARR